MQRIEHQLNVGVTICVISGTAICALNAAALHVPYVANDFRSFFHFRAADVISRCENCRKGDSAVNLFWAWLCVPVLQPVQCSDAEATRITFYAAAVEYLEVPRRKPHPQEAFLFVTEHQLKSRAADRSLRRIAGRNRKVSLERLQTIPIVAFVPVFLFL